MRVVEIPAEQLEAVKRRRGRLHVFADFDPATAALVVVDMQNAFVAPGGLAEVPAARDIVPNINRIAGSIRRAGGAVVWIRGSVESSRGSWAHYLANSSGIPQLGARRWRPAAPAGRYIPDSTSRRPT